MKREIQIDEKYVIKSPVNGNENIDEIILDYRDNLLTWGASLNRANVDGIYCINCELPNNVSIDNDDLQYVVSKDNGQVYGHMPFVKMPEASLEAEVPEGIPNRLKTIIVDGSNPEEVITEEVPKTWAEWSSKYSAPVVIEGQAYFNSNIGNYNPNDALLGTELVVVLQAGFDLVDVRPEIPTTEE